MVKTVQGIIMGDYKVTKLGYVLFIAILFTPSDTLPSRIRIGAIFTEHQREGDTEVAFKYAIHRINQNKILLPNTTLEYDIQYVRRDDSFHATKKACRLLGLGVHAIFGPSDPLLASHIQSICNALGIPHMEARLDIDTRLKIFSTNLYPSHEDMNRAYKDMMTFLNWTKAAIVYEEDFGLMKPQDLIRFPPGNNMDFYIRPATPQTYRTILREIKNKNIFNVVVDTKPANIDSFLKVIMQLQMNDYRYHYLFTTFDIETYDLEDFKYNNVHITAFRVVDADSDWVRSALVNMRQFQSTSQSVFNKTNVIMTEPALMYDSVNVLARGIEALNYATILTTPNVTCDPEVHWNGGIAVFNHINSLQTKGLTGPIQFGIGGRRNNLKLDILKLKNEHLAKVGTWSLVSGINITDKDAFDEGRAPDVTLLVTTIEEIPFVMVRQGKNLTGNNRFEGFCIDLLQQVSEQVGFRYEIQLASDKIYGTYNKDTGQWNGIVKRLIDKEADLAVAPMTINSMRERVIAFTKPFMNIGIGILFKEAPQSMPTHLFSFMNPFAIEIWLYILAAYLLVSFAIYIVARFSPYECYTSRPSQEPCDSRHSDFTIGNSLWFTIGTLMQQGSDLTPKAVSTRIVSGIWCFFTLIIISSYTANLAAYLTVERMTTPINITIPDTTGIESVDDLAAQNEIRYGTLEGGSTMSFFMDSRIETYRRMWEFMESKKPSVFVNTYEEGVMKVLEGDYAFLMESPMLDYIVQRNCSLTQVGGLLDSKGYGIATPIGSPWRDKISLSILDLQERGFIQMLYSKWWKKNGEFCNRNDMKKSDKSSALGVANIGGVFIVLLCGLALAIIVAILEYCWISKKNALGDRKNGEVPLFEVQKPSATYDPDV